METVVFNVPFETVICYDFCNHTDEQIHVFCGDHLWHLGENNKEQHLSNDVLFVWQKISVSVNMVLKLSLPLAPPFNLQVPHLRVIESGQHRFR